MYYVSRQSYWGVPENEQYMVEIAKGGLDYANPDMLVTRYESLGEGQDYEDPRKALEAAIAIRKAWKKDQKEYSIGIASGYTGGMTAPFEKEFIKDLRAWAKKEWESLPKCSGCGSVMKKNGERYEAGYITLDGDFLPNNDGFEYCSETCSQKACEYEKEMETA